MKKLIYLDKIDIIMFVDKLCLSINTPWVFVDKLCLSINTPWVFVFACNY